eukprot:GGOE01030115.1.p6 GENE.GGOE01030115.1~~GGOE01030115.1.p6  ORF type:complete len:102 (+),score=6.90 GGOE01030115.1:748-1053(+)
MWGKPINGLHRSGDTKVSGWVKGDNLGCEQPEAFMAGAQQAMPWTNLPRIPEGCKFHTKGGGGDAWQIRGRQAGLMMVVAMLNGQENKFTKLGSACANGTC